MQKENVKEIYNAKLIEEYWQKEWDKNNSFKTSISKDKSKNYYVLEMFPYPSGRIHMGHVRVYTLGDVLARFKRAQGFQVFHPMGWDAFGMPAENAAFENKIHPKDWTLSNIEIMKNQLKSMGLSYDWNNEISTCDSTYIYHQQILFIKLFKEGLAYRKKSWAYWDPIEQTVLANEQVIEGKGWRSGAVVEKKLLDQWFFSITKFADQLLSELDNLKNWPEKVKTMQKNWIGKSEGVKIIFNIKNNTDKKIYNSQIEIFTTRPDTIFGASFLAISPDHPLTVKLEKWDKNIKLFVTECRKTTSTEETLEKSKKEGIYTGLKATHPFSKRELPIYIANFVLLSYGTGAIFGVPAHDQRDYEFANNVNLPILQVVTEQKNSTPKPLNEAYIGEGYICNSEFLNGLSINEAKDEVIKRLESKGEATKTIQYRLRDWCASRQRYWGCPVPIIHCSHCGIIPEKEDNLPVLLPEDVTFDKPGNPLDFHNKWKTTTCHNCGSSAIRDTQTFDTFVDSSWYYYRYINPKYSKPIDKELVNIMCPIHQYVGGIEHAILHLLYSRFFTKALHKIKEINFTEPFDGLFCQGMVCHQTYKDHEGNWLYPEDVILYNKKLVHRNTHKPVTIGRSEKMSKSKRNIVDPVTIIENYGADVARLFILSDSPPDRTLEWTTNGIDGAKKYLTRIWNFFQSIDIDALNNSALNIKDKESVDLQRLTHLTIDKVTNNLNLFQYNVAVASLREFSNYFMQDKYTKKSGYSYVFKNAIESWIVMFSPMIPHIMEELWKILKNDSMLVNVTWPVVNQNILAVDFNNVVIQINGKKKLIIEMPTDITKEETEKKALEGLLAKNILKGKNPKRIIVVPNRVVNIVL